MSKEDVSVIPAGERGGVRHVVAIGASAGGLQALRPIVAGLERRGVAAYVLAQHLSPGHASNLAQLLATHSALSVVTASDGDQLLADHIYVCPPGCDIQVRDGQVHLDNTSRTRISPSIDLLFCSAAEHYGDASVAVILSGSGRDGSAGAQAIVAAGGLVIVQVPEEAVQSSMPDAAIAAGVADLCGTTGQIVGWLNHVDTVCERTGALRDEQGDGAFETLLAMVTRASGLDLGRYKENTLRRQTTRRYRMLGIPSLERYLAYVEKHEEELFLLQQTFLISVSSFFRDPAEFDELEKALRQAVAKKQPGDAIRVWVPACATGEEAYSVAILLGELLGDRLGAFDVRVFATDIDQVSLDEARAGTYLTEELAHLDLQRCQRWFVPDGNRWRISKRICELCIFSVHDVIGHPPFIKMDLISCRNLLIYFKPEQQADLIGTFHYALVPDGLLLLGRSESVGFNSPLFELIDPNHKLYRRRGTATSHLARFARFGVPVAPHRPLLPRTASTPQRQSLVGATQQVISREYGPPGVLVNAGFEPLQFFGRSQRYFALPGDEADFSVFSLCLPELRNELKALCYRMVQEGVEQLCGVGVSVDVDGQRERIRPVLRRIAAADNGDQYAYLISFELWHGESAPLAEVEHVSDDRADEIVRLRQELAETREHLQMVIEELEASNEELQSLNEELQSSGEELQSSNEELQSSNEELTTLNDELRAKSMEANQLSATLGNIQNSIRNSLVVVDREGHITRFNALATRIFGLVANDVGELLYGVPCHLDLPQLREQIGEVVATGASLVERVHQRDFHYLMQVDPYLNELGENTGAVLTFADISDLHRAEAAQESVEARFRLVWDASLEGLLVVDAGGRITLVNPALQDMFGYGVDELIGQTVELLVPEPLRHHHRHDRAAFAHGPKEIRDKRLLRDLRGRKKDGSEFSVEIGLSRLTIDGNECVLASVSNVTDRKRAEDFLRESELRLRLALDAASAGTWEWYLDSNANAWSSEAAALYGLDPAGTSPSFDVWQDTVHPEDRERVLDVVQSAARDGKEFEVEWRVNLPPGQPVRWLMSRGRPVMDDDGRPARYNGIVMDVSARRESDARKRRSDALEAELRVVQQVLETSLAGYWDWNIALGTEYLSPSFKAMFGYADEELRNAPETWQALIFAEDLPGVRDVFEAHVNSHGAVPYYNEVRYHHKNGSTVWVICAGRVVQWSDDGAPVRMVGCHIDITPIKRHAEQLAAATRRAEAANRAKSAFLANMSHEIRTPLNAIIGLASVVRRATPEAEHDGKLARIQTAAQHLLAVINDILDLSKIEADKFVLEDMEFDLATTVDNVTAMLHERAMSKGLQLVSQTAEFSYQVRGDPTRFTQALLNLASNAVKFTESGSVSLHVFCTAETDDRVLVRAEVRDTGIGVPRETLERLFVPFEQGDQSNTRRYGGTGLGLAITLRLAKLMGGEAGGGSTVGVGSTFWFTAWLGKGQVTRAAAPTAQPAESAEEILRRNYRGTRILLADDEPINQEVATMFLTDAGLDVAIAGDGLTALQMASDGDYALILMDMQMPGLDGLEATRRLRRMPAGDAVPIVAMTANAYAENRDQCLAAGMNDFIAKPFDPDALFAMVLRWLASRHGGAARDSAAGAAPE